MRGWVPAVATALVLAGCGGGSGGLDGDEAQAIADRALLREADLGAGWALTGTDRPGGDGAQDDQLQRCVGDELDVTDETLAESDTRTFERAPSDTEQQQVVVTSAVLRSEEHVDGLVDLIATDRFAACITQTMQQAIATEGDGGVTLTADRAEIDRGTVETADRSAHVAAPVHLVVDALRVDGRFDMLVVATDQVVSLLFGFALGPPIDPTALDRWAGLLASRQKGR